MYCYLLGSVEFDESVFFVIDLGIKVFGSEIYGDCVCVICECECGDGGEGEFDRWYCVFCFCRFECVCVLMRLVCV